MINTWCGEGKNPRVGRMSQVVETQIGKRGFFGWLFLLLFWAFSALMALWAWTSFSLIHEKYVTASGQYSEAQQAATAIGGAIGGAVILFVWVAGGAVILGLLALLTRGRKTVIIRTAT
jgi:hypothetical protein